MILLKYKYNQYRSELNKVDKHYHEVLKKLQKQKKMSRSSTEIPPFIGSIQLRDLILAREADLSRRLQLWKKVTAKVEHNTNVVFQSVENYGEIMKVWEWVSDME